MLPQLHMPPSTITKSYTTGGEYIIANIKDRQEYIGYFHIYPNGAIYSGDKYTSDSIELKKVPPEYFSSPLNGTYFKLSNKAFFNHVDPQYYTPSPTANDRKLGVIPRYFACKRNEDVIIEIDLQQARRANKANKKGINKWVWNVVSIEWTISGNEDQVRKANKRVTSFMSRKVPFLSIYLTNLLEFHQ